MTLERAEDQIAVPDDRCPVRDPNGKRWPRADLRRSKRKLLVEYDDDELADKLIAKQTLETAN